MVPTVDYKIQSSAQHFYKRLRSSFRVGARLDTRLRDGAMGEALGSTRAKTGAICGALHYKRKNGGSRTRTSTWSRARTMARAWTWGRA